MEQEIQKKRNFAGKKTESGYQSPKYHVMNKSSTN